MNKDQEFLDFLVRVIKKNLVNPRFGISSMATETGISDRHLQRKVKALTGRSPMQYLRDFRLEKSLQYLRDGMPVGAAARAVGFSSHAYFTSCFRSKFGITPQQLQDQAARTSRIDNPAYKRRDIPK